MSESQDVATIEPPQQLITIEPKKYVELVFEPFAKRLADAKVQAKAAQFDVTTTAGMAVAVKHRATFRDIRVGSEKARKERKAPILEIGKLLDSRQKEIEAEIEPFESRFDDAIKAEEARKEAERQAKAAAEAERIRSIKARIERFMLDAVVASDGTAAAIDAHATKLSETVISLEEFAEFAGEAQMKRDDTVKWLRERQQQAAEREAEARRLSEERAELERQRAEEAAKLARERAELERQRAEEAERERQAVAARAEEERKAREALAELRRDRAAEEARLRAERGAEEARLAEQRAEIARQQAEIDAAKAEQERKERERLAAIEAEERRKREEAEAMARAEAEHKAAKERVKEAERLRRLRVEFEAKGPGDRAIVEAVATRFEVPEEVALSWLAKFNAMAFAIES